jgi:hypothetical protein
MMPRALRAYTKGLRTHDTRAMYSRVKASVKNHSRRSRLVAQRRCSVGKLSTMTTATLPRISHTNSRSKIRPARVSDSKMIR